MEFNQGRMKNYNLPTEELVRSQQKRQPSGMQIANLIIKDDRIISSLPRSLICTLQDLSSPICAVPEMSRAQLILSGRRMFGNTCGSRDL
jgi:hypothetical protein